MTEVDKMARIGIIAALNCELEMFLEDFGAKETEYSGIFKGEYSGHEIYLTLCGVGKVNAAVCAQRMFDLTKVEAVINSGVAGGISKNLGICDLAISDKLTYHDFYPLDILEKYAPGTSVFNADKTLVKLAKDAAEALISSGEKFKYEVGTIVSGDMFVEDDAYNAKLHEKFGAVCTEMEGAAIAHAAILNKVPFVVIRAISDNADSKADMTFEQMAAIAAKRACFIVKEMLSNY